MLSDGEKRSLYDRFGEAGIKGDYQESGAGSQGVKHGCLHSSKIHEEEKWDIFGYSCALDYALFSR